LGEEMVVFVCWFSGFFGACLPMVPPAAHALVHRLCRDHLPLFLCLSIPPPPPARLPLFTPHSIFRFSSQSSGHQLRPPPVNILVAHDHPSHCHARIRSRLLRLSLSHPLSRCLHRRGFVCSVRQLSGRPPREDVNAAH